MRHARPFLTWPVRATFLATAVALVAALVGLSAAPARANLADTFYSIVDTEGNTISGYEADGVVPVADAPGIRFWFGLNPDILTECSEWQSDTLKFVCTNLSAMALTLSQDRPCVYDQPYPLVDGSACIDLQFVHAYFNPGQTAWVAGQASATGVDAAGTAYEFDHWEIRGATNAGATCLEGSTSATCTFSVVPRTAPFHMTAVYAVAGAYTSSGFSAPVDANALNLAKAGQSIPLKWHLSDATGAPVTDLTDVAVTTTAHACESGDSAGDALDEYASGESGLQNLGDGDYQYNWKTPKAYAGRCLTLHLDLGDGVDRTAEFTFTK